ncbi:MAG: serine kinase [Deltaproteobacteria bacterium]|nr:serine kinase [Deltaproteobacteria bacterium]
MKVIEIVKLLRLSAATGEEGLDREAETGYCGDLLSDVMANSKKGALWLTIQSHQNIVAVAVLRELAAVILVNGRMPDEETKIKAQGEGVPILLSPLPAYELAGKLYEIGIGRA